jgi:hypothetical protein
LKDKKLGEDEEFEQAAQYWNRKGQTAMPKEALQQAHFNLQW